MKEHRETLLQLPHGRRSLLYLLHEDKLRKCGLLGEGQSTFDWSNIKYEHWEQVPLPTGALPPRRETRPPLVVRLRSPLSRNEANDEASSSDSDEGKVLPTSRMWSPTLLKHRPNWLVSCPQDRYHFYIWSWVDDCVHRFDSGLGKYDTMYTTDEVWNGIAVQYGTNDNRDLSRLSPTYREGTPPASSEDGGISWSPSSSSGESSS